MGFLDGYCDGLIDQMNCTGREGFLCPVQSGDTVYLNTRQVCSFIKLPMLLYKNIFSSRKSPISPCRVRLPWTCNKKSQCTDGGDEWCHQLNSDCWIHKHQLCDGVADCEGGPDEAMGTCMETSLKTCIRRYITVLHVTHV